MLLAGWMNRLNERVTRARGWLVAGVESSVGRLRGLARIRHLDALATKVGEICGLGSEGRSRVRHGVAAVVILGVCLAFVAVITNPGYRTVAIAKPALPSITWEQRVAQFSDRLTGAFGLEPARAGEFAAWILEAADRQRLEPELIASLVQVESAFRKHAHSHAGAIGPAQVKPHYWTEFCGGDDLSDPRHNIHCGAQVLAYLKELCGGGGDCALIAYNIGRNSSREQAGRRYVSKVDHHLLNLKAL